MSPASMRLKLMFGIFAWGSSKERCQSGLAEIRSFGDLLKRRRVGIALALVGGDHTARCTPPPRQPLAIHGVGRLDRSHGGDQGGDAKRRTCHRCAVPWADSGFLHDEPRFQRWQPTFEQSGFAVLRALIKIKQSAAKTVRRQTVRSLLRRSSRRRQNVSCVFNEGPYSRFSRERISNTGG
jgi:hypothetical protein